MTKQKILIERNLKFDNTYVYLDEVFDIHKEIIAKYEGIVEPKQI